MNRQEFMDQLIDDILGIFPEPIPLYKRYDENDGVMGSYYYSLNDYRFSTLCRMVLTNNDFLQIIVCSHEAFNEKAIFNEYKYAEYSKKVISAVKLTLEDEYKRQVRDFKRDTDFLEKSIG